jgi:hypothetical protein
MQITDYRIEFFRPAFILKDEIIPREKIRIYRKTHSVSEAIRQAMEFMNRLTFSEFWDYSIETLDGKKVI